MTAGVDERTGSPGTSAAPEAEHPPPTRPTVPWWKRMWRDRTVLLFALPGMAVIPLATTRSRELGVVWASGAKLSPPVAAFLEFMTEHAG